MTSGWFRFSGLSLAMTTALLITGVPLPAALAADPRPPAQAVHAPLQPVRTPSQVAQSIAEACKERRYSEVGASLHPTLRHTWILIGYTVPAYCDQITRDETLTDVRIVKEERTGAHAVVYVTFVYRDGSETADRAGFQQDRGVWKLSD